MAPFRSYGNISKMSVKMAVAKPLRRRGPAASPPGAGRGAAGVFFRLSVSVKIEILPFGPFGAAERESKALFGHVVQALRGGHPGPRSRKWPRFGVTGSAFFRLSISVKIEIFCFGPFGAAERESKALFGHVLLALRGGHPGPRSRRRPRSRDTVPIVKCQSNEIRRFGPFGAAERKSKAV